MPYTIDGDIYRTEETLRITVGPNVAIVDPRVDDHDSAALRRSPYEDTMNVSP
jgi:hypothetical protein